MNYSTHTAKLGGVVHDHRDHRSMVHSSTQISRRVVFLEVGDPPNPLKGMGFQA